MQTHEKQLTIPAKTILKTSTTTLPGVHHFSQKRLVAAQSLAALLWALSTNLEQNQKTQDLLESISNICDATRWKDVES